MSEDRLYRNTICLGGLYVRKGKKGEYLTGKLNNNRIMIFKNGKKEKESDPDYKIFLTPDRKKKESEEY